MKKNTQSIEESAHEALAGHALADAESPLLLMVSGGSDSCGLAYAMHALSERGAVGPLSTSQFIGLFTLLAGIILLIILRTKTPLSEDTTGEAAHEKA